MKGKFLPICKKDMEERGITQFDFVYIIGDAYVDHPSFGHALISRLLEAHGYTVGIISQPDWKQKERNHIHLRRATACVPGQQWKYGFHGKPLQCVQTAAGSGLLYAWRRHGKTPRLRSHSLRKPDSSNL